jgi:hypothetical protein
MPIRVLHPMSWSSAISKLRAQSLIAMAITLVSLSALVSDGCRTSGNKPPSAQATKTGVNDSRSATRSQSACEASGPVLVSSETIGPLSTALPVGRLLTICSGVRTVLETEESQYPAVEFHFGDLKVLASQTTSDSLQLDQPADTWEVTGANGTLPLGIPLNSDWVALRRAYGTAIGKTMSDKVTLMFCKFPGMFLDLDADIRTIGPIVNNDLTRIPSNAKIVRVIISLDPVGGWNCA